MKKSFIVAAFVFVLGSAIDTAERLLGHPTFSLLNIATAAGSVFVCRLLLIALNDYARKPRFRLRSTRLLTTHSSRSATSPNAGAACDWTYTTRSA